MLDAPRPHAAGRACAGSGAGVLDDLALHPLAAAAAALVAVARTAATVAGAVLGFFLGLAMGAFVGLDQRLTVGDREFDNSRDGFR